MMVRFVTKNDKLNKKDGALGYNISRIRFCFKLDDIFLDEEINSTAMLQG
eukprot:m.163161 g.163161  ORF g.163161 m.163161 type:complete len:50 (-) comp31279_c5_seq4:39-188(-)